MTNPTNSPFPWTKDWRLFSEELSYRLEQFRQQMATSWNDLQSQLARLEEASRDIVSEELQAGKLHSIQSCYGPSAENLLIEPLRTRLKARNQQRALAAISDLNTAAESLATRLPATIRISGSGLVLALQPEGRSLRSYWTSLHSTVEPLHLRQVTADSLLAEEEVRSKLDGQFQLLLAQATLHLTSPWKTYRQRTLEWLADPDEEPASLDKKKQRWAAASSKYGQQSRRPLERYDKWSRGVERALVENILRRPVSWPAVRQEKLRSTLHEHFSYWSRQQKAIQGQIELELALARLANGAVDAAAAALDALEQEHVGTVRELESVVSWLDSYREGASAGGFPEPEARVESAEARFDEYQGEVEKLATTELPETVEAIQPKRALPGWRKPWRQLEPRAVFTQALRGSGRRLALEGFREAEAAHRAIVREIERAREVVRFSMEASSEGSEEGNAVAGEGIVNAIELLRYWQQSIGPARDTVERRLTRSIAATFLECHIALEQGRLGLLTHLFQEAGERGARRLWHLGLVNGRRAAFAGWRRMRQVWNGALFGLGLKTPPVPLAPAFSRVPHLDRLLEFTVVPPELPTIYRRLFRLEPLEDSRFMVGRDDELAGLTEARSLWMTGKAVSVLVVGARGSGKTSLLNCAAQVAFAGLEQHRGQFRGRLVSPESIESFLRELLKLPAESSLRESLDQRQRVIILEEIERTFLRRIQGFEGLRFLLELVNATRHSTLWVLSLNEKGAEYLDQAVQLRRYFTYHINAMAVSVDEIRSAVLLRHNLSGYRLSFAAPPEKRQINGRLRRRLGLELDAEELFFEALYEHAEGIFRSAFELWQRHIERIEGGVVHLRQPVNPDFDRLIGSFLPIDHLTLQAMLQHGGLTAEELAEVFREPEFASNSRLGRLAGLGLVEPDPRGPGFRVRPEAGRLVREALQRQNL